MLQFLLLTTHSTANAVELVQEGEFQRQSKSVRKKGGISLTDQTNRTQGYLIAHTYEQQLTAGLHSFFELSNITAGLHLSTVEPFVQDTNIKGIPDFTSQLGGQEFWMLSKFYDLHRLQATLQTCSSLHQLVSFDTILTKAPHDVVVVYFLTTKNRHLEQYFSDGNHPIVELDHKESGRIFKLIHTLRSLNKWAVYNWWTGLDWTGLDWNSRIFALCTRCAIARALP